MERFLNWSCRPWLWIWRPRESALRSARGSGLGGGVSRIVLVGRAHEVEHGGHDRGGIVAALARFAVLLGPVQGEAERDDLRLAAHHHGRDLGEAFGEAHG